MIPAKTRASAVPIGENRVELRRMFGSIGWEGVKEIDEQVVTLSTIDREDHLRRSGTDQIRRGNCIAVRAALGFDGFRVTDRDLHGDIRDRLVGHSVIDEYRKLAVLQDADDLVAIRLRRHPRKHRRGGCRFLIVAMIVPLMGGRNRKTEHEGKQTAKSNGAKSYELPTRAALIQEH